MTLIDAEKLYKKTVALEDEALEILKSSYEQKEVKTPTVDQIRWTAILGERSAFKHDIMDAPTIDAIPVVQCKDCKYNYANMIPSHSAECSLYVELPITNEFYCAKGEREKTNEHD